MVGVEGKAAGRAVLVDCPLDGGVDLHYQEDSPHEFSFSPSETWEV